MMTSWDVGRKYSVCTFREDRIKGSYGKEQVSIYHCPLEFSPKANLKNGFWLMDGSRSET